MPLADVAAEAAPGPLRRIHQAVELWPGFRAFVLPPADELTIRLTELADRFARFADEFEEVRKELRAERPLRVGPRYASPKVAAGRKNPAQRNEAPHGQNDTPARRDGDPGLAAR